MKRCIVAILLLCSTIQTPAAVIRGVDGRWYGNICITQVGWQEVPWQLVGSMCYSPMWRQYGFIANA
jgi:hypothetical protein